MLSKKEEKAYGICEIKCKKEKGGLSLMATPIISNGCENCRWSHHAPESRCSCICHKDGTAYRLPEWKDVIAKKKED